MSATDVLDRLSSYGCHVRLEGDKLKVRGPNRPEVKELVSELHREREAAIAFLQHKGSKPPSLEEVKATLPPCIAIVSYEPKKTPFAVSTVSVVTNVGKFFCSYLRDLAWRIKHPKGYATAPLGEILGKLSSAGLELRFKTPSEMANERTDQP